MGALVVYESMFGNTRAVAAAVAEGLSSLQSVTVVEVGTAPAEIGADVDLLIVGGPTHAFSMSRKNTREDASKDAAEPLVSNGHGIREWLTDAQLPTSVHAAAFDTRINRPRLPGSAAVAATRRLRRLGAHVIADATSFYVHGKEGPLVAGELGRARSWGEVLALEVGRVGAR